MLISELTSEDIVQISTSYPYDPPVFNLTADFSPRHFQIITDTINLFKSEVPDSFSNDLKFRDSCCEIGEDDRCIAVSIWYHRSIDRIHISTEQSNWKSGISYT